MLQRPMALGADIVVYSATKHIDGQGRCLGGVVLGGKEFIEEKLHTYLKQTGPSLSPFNAWVLLKGLETLPLRVERHESSAAAIADFLAERKEVVRVFYPGRDDHPQAALAKRQMAGGGPLVAFEVKGDKKNAFRLMNALRIFKITNNLGDAKSLVTHPATTTHQRLSEEARAELGIFDRTLRLSVGLEDVEDLKADLDRALRRVAIAAARGAGAPSPCLRHGPVPILPTPEPPRRDPMCRNIKTLHNFDPPATDEEIQASSLQFVRKLSGFAQPSKANKLAFDRAVDKVAAAARELIDALVTDAPPRDRAVEAAKLRARSAERFRGSARQGA